MAQKQELITKEAQRAMAPRSPFEEMERMMDRMFEGFFPRGWMRPAGFPRPEMGAGQVRMPNVDVVERDEEVLVRAELPGVDKKDIDVSVSDSSLTITATPPQAAEEEGEYYCCEIGAAPFTRTVQLPADVEGEKAKASFKDGLLELRLPKTERARRRAISID